MITPELRAQVDARLAELLVKVRAKRPTFPAPSVTYYDNALAAGRAIYRRNTIELNAVLLRENLVSMLHETVAHELAHLVVQFDWLASQFAGRLARRPAPHGPVWRSIMHYVMGVTPERTHNYDVSNVQSAGAKRTFVYKCACTTHKVTARKHANIQRPGSAYRCKRCKVAISYVPPGEVAE